VSNKGFKYYSFVGAVASKPALVEQGLILIREGQETQPRKVESIQRREDHADRFEVIYVTPQGEHRKQILTSGCYIYFEVDPYDQH
jgi:hypothetical protein